ncbi:recombinase family protein [Arthrobacter castelli]|uniref:recombinase family protein n=1 Tax=Arthrobacter castelli TaxID=271431 RepID=UPI00040ED3C4|nr:recombinase family protein [Arthrobacter castelli]
MANAIEAAVYVRISRDSEADGLGVKRQESDCHALAKKLGWTVIDVYTDNDVSASKKKPRPAYEQMMRAVESRRIQAVVVWDVDRLTRKPRELEDWIDHADALGLQLASVGGEIDLANEQGRAMARMKGVFARLEAETTARRQRAKHKEMAEAGRYVGRRPFGYRFATDEKGVVLTGTQQRLVIDPAEAAVIKECVRRVLDGESLWSMTKDLNAREIRTAAGGEWQPQPLRRTLLRWTQAGYRKHQEFKDGHWTGPVQLFAAGWDAIIDRETHERVVARLTDPSRTTNKGDTELKYLLTWLVRCGECDRPMAGAKSYTYTVKGYKRVDGTRSPSKQRVYPAKYACPHSGCHGVNRRMDVVDGYIERHVVALLEVEGVRVLGGDQEVAAEARERIEAVEAKMALISDTWIDGGLTQEQFHRQNARLMARLEGEQARLRAAQPADGLDDFAGVEAGVAWLTAGVERKRMVLRALIDLAGLRITIDKIGPGAFSATDSDPYKGIRVEWS